MTNYEKALVKIYHGEFKQVDFPNWPETLYYCKKKGLLTGTFNNYRLTESGLSHIQPLVKKGGLRGLDRSRINDIPPLMWPV